MNKKLNSKWLIISISLNVVTIATFFLIPEKVDAWCILNRGGYILECTGDSGSCLFLGPNGERDICSGNKAAVTPPSQSTE